MPRKIDYPRASLARSLDAAAAVDSLGGKCSAEMCAEKMGMKIGGGFKSIISAARKFNLIDTSKGHLTVTDLYKAIKYSYTEEEKLRYIGEAFLSVPDFQELYQRFLNQRLPLEFFDRLLIREFGVDPSIASRVASYFTEGAKLVGILDDNNILVGESSSAPAVQEVERIEAVDIENTNGYNRDSTSYLNPSEVTTVVTSTDEYLVHIKGPGIDTKIIIKEEEDIDIISLTLNKIKKKLLL